MPTESSSKPPTSASVSKKQEQLESGRRKLLEFRKKKAEEKKNREKNRLPEKLTDGEGILINVAGLNAANEDDATEVVSIPLDRGKDVLEERADIYVHGAPHTVESTDAAAKISNNGSHDTAKINFNSSMYDEHKTPPWARGVHNTNSSLSMNDLIKGGNMQDAPNGYLSDGSTRASFQGLTMSYRQNGTPFSAEKMNRFTMQLDRQDRLSYPFQSTQKVNGMKSGSYENLSSFTAQTTNSSPFQPNISNHRMPISNSRDDAFLPYAHGLSKPVLNLDKENIRNTEKYVGKPEENHIDSQKDDFSALEQHIDELTQEKFSLQRALDAARSLSESLSQQNSSLTEDFNSQATFIIQLQEELDKKNEELASQSLVLSSLMMERERAQQENNAAIERFQILAGEVITLEEKVLKLRSSELKLQRDLESLNSEKDSYRAQLSTFEKDKQHLQSILEALQEDKEVLQRRLENVVAGDLKPAVVVQKETKEASTSTHDIGTEVSSSNHDSPQFSGDVYNLSSSIVLPMPLESGLSELSSFTTLTIDDHRVINSIDMLITDLVAEKSYLLQTLTNESSKVAELQALNKELSKKLEVQTQRLELAVTQNMADGLNSDITNFVEDRSEVDFVDEGDEVVERVLGWIMKLFPSGSSKRRTSRLL